VQSSGEDCSAFWLTQILTRADATAYVNKRAAKNGTERFTGLYKAADGTYKSAAPFDTQECALEVSEAAERHARMRLTETSPADKATVTLAT